MKTVYRTVRSALTFFYLLVIIMSATGKTNGNAIVAALQEPAKKIPTIHLVTPNGGEQFGGPTWQMITWTGTNLEGYYRFEITTDGGNTWSEANVMEGANTHITDVGGSIFIAFPQVTTTQAKVRVSLYLSPEISDMSDDVFSITSIRPINVTLYSNIYNIITVNSSVQINYDYWENPDSDKVNILLSTNNGANWQTIATNLTLDPTISNQYVWHVPTLPSDSCIIKIISTTNPFFYGTSLMFPVYPIPSISICPLYQESMIHTDSILTFRYSRHDKSNLFNNYNLFLSKDLGTTWQYLKMITLNELDGSFQVLAPSEEIDSCLFRVANILLSATSDTSSYFTIRNFPDVPICLVTNDDETRKNLVKWANTESSYISKYIIYRETESTGNYEEIGRISPVNNPEFVDTNSFPRQQANRYCISYVDSNNCIYPLSPPHQTIHLNISKGAYTEWNLIWSPYEGYPVESYKIYRDFSTDNMGLLTTVSGNITSYTDYTNDNSYVLYYVEAVNNEFCGNMSNRNSVSNTVNSQIDGIDIGTAGSTGCRVYPNPADKSVFVSMDPSIQDLSYTIADTRGRVLISQPSSESVYYPLEISTAGLGNGIYLLSIRTTNSVVQKKVMISR